MGTFFMRPTIAPLEEVYRRVLQASATRWFLQSDFMDDKTIDAIWDYFLTIWTEWNGELYGKDYDEQQAIALEMTQASHADLRSIKTLCQWHRKHYFTCKASRTDFNLDQSASRCIPGNSISDFGTKHQPRIVWVPLIPMLEQGGMQGGGWYHNSVKTSIFKILLTLSPICFTSVWACMSVQ
jgi:hypothetical protein